MVGHRAPAASVFEADSFLRLPLLPGAHGRRRFSVPTKLDARTHFHTTIIDTILPPQLCSPRVAN